MKLELKSVREKYDEKLMKVEKFSYVLGLNFVLNSLNNVN
jgi:hypothetical protein